MIDETAEERAFDLYEAMRRNEITLPFELADLDEVEKAYNISLWLTQSEIMEKLEQDTRLVAYLKKYTSEEIAGHILMYRLEWWC